MAKNTIKKIGAYFGAAMSVALVCLVIIASCGPYASMHLRQSSPIERNKPPIDAFVIVKVYTKVTPDFCDPVTDSCKKIIDTLPPIKTAKTGSGMLVWHDGRSFILTAAHVCDTSDEPTHFKYPEKDIRIKLNVESKVRITGVNGMERDAEIVSMNNDTDICALSAPDFKGTPVELSIVPPRVGDKVHSIAAPYGLGGESLSLIFAGRYSGQRRGMHYYTIPTRPGSSGAIVLNDNWQAVGSLHTAYVPLESIGMGAGWQDLKVFLESIL